MWICVYNHTNPSILHSTSSELPALLQAGRPDTGRGRVQTEAGPRQSESHTSTHCRATYIRTLCVSLPVPVTCQLVMSHNVVMYSILSPLNVTPHSLLSLRHVDMTQTCHALYSVNNCQFTVSTGWPVSCHQTPLSYALALVTSITISVLLAVFLYCTRAITFGKRAIRAACKVLGTPEPAKSVLQKHTHSSQSGLRRQV